MTTTTLGPETRLFDYGATQGYPPPRAGLPAYCAIVTQERPELEAVIEHDRAGMLRAAHERIGRLLIGLRQIDYRRALPPNPLGHFVWERRGERATGGLPAGLVDAADSAVGDEEAARRVFLTTIERADAYARERNLSWDAGNAYRELQCADAALAVRQAAERTAAACTALGRAADELTQAHTTLAGIATRRAALEELHARRKNEIDSAESAATLTLRRYGIPS